MWAEIASLISGIFKPATDLVDNLHTSTEEKLELKAKMLEIEKELLTQLTAHLSKVLEAQKAIIIAEAQGSWLQKNWRPLFMLMIVGMIFNNYIFVPYLNAWFEWGVELIIPDSMWTLLQYGLGGYVGGRSLEKIVSTVKGKVNG